MKIFGFTLALCALHYVCGENAHTVFHEDHYVDGKHNPEHDMNAFLGTEDKEEIKKLSPSEQKKRLGEIIKKIDADSNKYLSAEEITVWIQRVYRKYALDDAKERFPDFDTNRDGIVSWDEYNMVMHDHLVVVDENTILEDPEEESLRYVCNIIVTDFFECFAAVLKKNMYNSKLWLLLYLFVAQLHLKEKRRFDFADVDGTPGLNLTEFLAFTHPSEVDHMADFAIEDVLVEYDTDRDGFISLKEFIGDLRPDGGDPSQWEIEETVRFKDLYDQDGDGKLNKEEQLRWVAPNSYGSAREEAIHLIKEMDGNGDGTLSESEILKDQETFMNSEVTDYGRQLHTSHDEL
ncbi:reticulocalbin-2 isoform X1 [Alosa sapidissima]|uniref:reticulocalbin-2 isoform X1 n=1 Tax=Alosa sapidissima TaxID=34773 RepID=UPI001C0A5884|nr:reticulocalbin-2 isoform X1 [Alosa sapidissima]XP_041967398.1 reticulocalbin-2 isoform X1 [Alosa sapidissima]